MFALDGRYIPVAVIDAHSRPAGSYVNSARHRPGHGFERAAGGRPAALNT
jgi:hypothetical protein